jgi:hypothetical protein
MENILIECSSNVFHVIQPNGYNWTGDMADFETSENFCYEQSLDEIVNGVKRRNLPKNHRQYLAEGRYEMDGQKFLNDCLVKAWFETFSELLAGCGKIKAALTGVDSPKYYNYLGDAALFNLEISREDLEAIRDFVFAHQRISDRDVFDDYLREYHSSYPGFISYTPQSIPQWKEDFSSEAPEEWTKNHVHHECWEYAIWPLLEFWLFAFDKDDPIPSLAKCAGNIRIFKEVFYQKMTDFREDGTYNNCLEFIPEEQETCILV